MSTKHTRSGAARVRKHPRPQEKNGGSVELQETAAVPPPSFRESLEEGDEGLDEGQDSFDVGEGAGTSRAFGSTFGSTNPMAQGIPGSDAFGLPGHSHARASALAGVNVAERRLTQL